MKKMKMIVAALALVALAVTASAVTVTNGGQVITITTLSELADSGRDVTVQQDWSTYAQFPGQAGQIIAFFSPQAVGSTASATYNLDQWVPKGAVFGEDSPRVFVSEAFEATNSVMVKLGGTAVVENVYNAIGVTEATYPAADSYLADSQRVSVVVGAAPLTNGAVMVIIPYTYGLAD